MFKILFFCAGLMNYCLWLGDDPPLKTATKSKGNRGGKGVKKRKSSDAPKQSNLIAYSVFTLNWSLLSHVLLLYNRASSNVKHLVAAWSSKLLPTFIVIFCYEK